MATSRETVVQTPKGIQIWTESFGDLSNPAILLIMGAMNQGLIWPAPFCEALAEAGFLVIRYDNRDTGKSSIINFMANPYNLDDMTADAIAVLDSYDKSKAIVMGMSMGGYIAQLMAINYPTRVDKLILLSSTADHRPFMYSLKGTYLGQFPLSPPADDYIFHITQAAFYVPKTPEDVFKVLLNGWRATHGGSSPFPEQEMGALIKKAMERVQAPMAALNHGPAVDNSPDRLKTINNITAPTLVLHGEFDPCLPIDHGVYLAEHIEDATLIKLDMGHMFPPTMAKQMAEYVLAFIKS